MVSKPTVTHLLGRQFDGYLGVRLPHELDDVMTSVVRDYLETPASARARVLEAIRPRSAAILSVYGQRMAAMAVRTASVDPIHRGVVAMGMADRMLDDARDNLIVLAAVSHSAEAVGTTRTACPDSVNSRSSSHDL